MEGERLRSLGGLDRLYRGFYTRDLKNGTLTREEAGELLVIRPPQSLGIRRTESDPKELERVYRIGRAEAERRLEEIRTFLQR